MDQIAGVSQTGYVKPSEIEAEHLRLLQSSLALFNDMADFGSQRSIQAARERVLNEIDSSFRLYEKLNESRNPLMGFEMYVSYYIRSTRFILIRILPLCIQELA